MSVSQYQYGQQGACVATVSPRHCEQAGGSTLVLLPTYNEVDNVLVAVAAVLSATPSHVDILVVDDASPDGTARLVAGVAGLNARVHLFERRGPRGLGAALMAGMQWGLRREYQYFIQMDADLSHDPADVPRLLAAVTRADLVIGSRYCPGGRLAGWPQSRKRLSFAANLYARTLLGARVADLTAGFRCWRRELLERIDFARLQCNGYGFQVEMGHLAQQAKARIVEIPICFTERCNGVSKMSAEIAWQAARNVLRLAANRWLGRRHPALLPERQTESLRRPARSILAMCVGGIGDAVLNVAALRDLRRRWPDAHITALTMWPAGAELLADLGICDEVIQHNFQTASPMASLRAVYQLHRRRFDRSVLMFPSNRFEFNALTWLIHATRRFGHRYRVGHDWTHLRPLLTDLIDQQPDRHVIEENLALVAAAGSQDGFVAPAPIDIRLGPVAGRYHREAEYLLADLSEPLLAIHAGSSTFKAAAMRRWPSERFAELCRRAKAELGLQPILLGGPAEYGLNEWIAARSGAAVIRTRSMRATAAVLQRCAVMVSNDSGLAHIGSALDVPVVMLVGPTNPAYVRPYAPTGTVVTLGLACSPCFEYSHRPLRCAHSTTSYACMRQISVDRVIEAVRSVVSQAARAQTLNAPQSWRSEVVSG